jgi:PEP-CTERM motif
MKSAISMAAVGATLFFWALAAHAAPFLIDFETVPPEPTGPSFFAAAGPAQTIVVPGVASISGGVILGNASFLPAQSFATPPNTYGTAGFGDASLSSTLSVTFNPAFGTVTEVSFPILNGSTAVESYVVNAFNGATLTASQTLSNLPANSSSGFGIVDVTAASITSLTIAPTLLNATCCNGWDFFIDSVALNQSVQQALAPTPEPTTLLLFGSVLAGIGALRRRYPHS